MASMLRHDQQKYLGKQYWKWTVIHYLEKRGEGRHGRHYYIGRCECGTEKPVDIAGLVNDRSKSCGCNNKEAGVKRSTHGKHGSPEYWAWAAMKDRCNNKNNPNYYRYGGRGILVCERWMKFEQFFADMGMKPSKKHTLERLDNDEGYSPSNCAWKPMLEQARNKVSNVILEIDGVKKCLCDWAKLSPVTYQTIQWRLRCGMTTKEAVFTPSRNNL